MDGLRLLKKIKKILNVCCVYFIFRKYSQKYSRQHMNATMEIQLCASTLANRSRLRNHKTVSL